MSGRAGVVLALSMVGAAQGVAAEHVALPIAIDHAVIQRALSASMFTGPDESLLMRADRNACTRLVLSRPRLDDGNAGRLRVTAEIAAQVGTPIGESCLFRFDWRGVLEVTQQVYVAGAGEALGFRTADSRLLEANGQRRGVPGVLWDWVKHQVHPLFEAFSFDLSPLMNGTRELLLAALATADDAGLTASESLRLRDPGSGAGRLHAILAFDVPGIPAAPPPAVAPLTEADLAAWNAHWQAWDAFATWTIKTATVFAPPNVRFGLLETLLEARYELRAALVQQSPSPDPVRGLFIRTWERLSPLLAEVQLNVDHAEALRYVAFISAGDALRAVDAVAPYADVRVDADTLRRLALALSPEVAPEDLAYSTDVDPALRRLFGFEAEFGATVAPAQAAILDWLVSPANAAVSGATEAQRLDAWVPGKKDLDAYLAAMDALLGSVAAHEEEYGKIPAAFISVYPPLLRATAWQETCWRQYVKRNDRIVAIRSAAGSIGLMQVNTHVWRGVYDIALLETDVGYNARAGNEILVHYLVDHAIRKNEHELAGDVDGLARAAYAAYNGGPGQLRRYREPRRKHSLRAIDEAFWQKYQTIREAGASAVRQCYGT